MWLSDFIVQHAAKWARRKGPPGIVWVDEFPELGERIAKATGVPYYGDGPEASATIPRERGKRSIVASLRAHGTGRNLTILSRMLFVKPPADGAAREQTIGRCLRQGQLADEVEVAPLLITTLKPWALPARRAPSVGTSCATPTAATSR
ncbi:hypothetical protein [Myxococcus sp. AB025B]|uniref:hypothetical protein n=1 Tax=Myxococcus sp. AB025B TaxID=2562794 RepID=UPI001E3314F2|nr:hypothetical protein [Myxococcus sp. AB025B]